MAGSAALPLDGLLVADFSRILAGPMVGMTLGDLGADVVKVESPGGDDTRSWAPPVDAEGRATYHHAANRNKRSIALDLKDPEDRALAQRLCERADVVVSNFKPGTLERFDLGHAAIAAVNPGIVHCEISGFGEGAGRDMPGYDPLAQAVGGLMSITGPPGSPSKTGVALVDVLAGLYASCAVLAALREREHSGRGQRVTINLLHTTLAALANQGTAWLDAGATGGLLGNAHPSIEPFGTYRAADGDLMICAGNDRQFAALCAALGDPALAGEAQFATNAGRVAGRDALRPRLERALAARGCAEWSEILGEAGVPAGPVNPIPAGFALAGALGLEAVDDTGGVKTVAFPARLSRTPARTRRRPPDLDEHGADLRAWLAP
jgi:crotonobetainyl-CoA:carnitine CoA-transferase CaiB-like acyl-CoA transferase